MPSPLVTNDAISFVVARNFVYNGTAYEMGDDFPQEDAIKDIETLVRIGKIIPVVDSYGEKPRYWHREVKLRSDVAHKFEVRYGRSLHNKVPTGATDAIHTTTLKGRLEGTSPTFDPAEHTVDEVKDHLKDLDTSTEEGTQEHNEVLEREAEEKDRKGVKAEPIYDPAEHTVNEVLDHLAEPDISVEEYNRILSAEKTGKARKGILEEHEPLED